MNRYHDEQAQRAAELYRLRPSEARTCPRLVAGKRCVAYNGHLAQCVCEQHRGVLDHGRIWLDEDGKHVLTGEPYHLHDEDLTRFTKDMEDLGLHVTVKEPAESMWNPGSTHLVLVTNPSGKSRTTATAQAASPGNVTWKILEEVVTTRWGGRRRGRSGRQRSYDITSPTGGYLTLEVTLRPRWCSLAVDRWRTTDRDAKQSGPWFKKHAWPLIKDAVTKRGGAGFLPGEGSTFAHAHPIDQAHLLDLLIAWVDAELTWGQPKGHEAALTESTSAAQGGGR